MSMRVVPVLWNTHVRSYECDRNRHVNNAVYIEYITESTIDAWSGVAEADWRMKKLSAEYRCSRGPGRPPARERLAAGQFRRA